MTGQTQLPRRHGRRMLLIAIASAMGLAICGCIRIPPRSFKQVKSPRGGRALGRRVAVVYSKHYQINVGGLEKLHSFDIHKYAKIYLALVTDGVLAPTDVFVPEAVTREQLLRVHTPAYLATLKDPRAVARYLEIPVVRVAPASLVDAAVLNAFRDATGGAVPGGPVGPCPRGAPHPGGGVNNHPRPPHTPRHIRNVTLHHLQICQRPSLHMSVLDPRQRFIQGAPRKSQRRRRHSGPENVQY